MEKFAKFILKKRNLLFTTLAVFAIICIYLTTLVVVNTDMTEYLPEDSNVKAGLQVMEAEFGEQNMAVLHVMFEGLSDEERFQVYEQLTQTPNVAAIAFDANSEAHVMDEFTLFTLTLEQGLTNTEEYAVVNTILDDLSQFTIEMSGGVEGVDIELNMHLITIPTIIILTIILFLMCHSWIEPIIFFINIGIAILINMGTNIMFDSISDITQMIAGLLQVALSMDYSIIFLNRYRQEKAAMEVEDHKLAMKNAIINSFSTISGISFTTIVGMLMLVFMSFTIGADIGFVIAKGVFISLICVFGVMPALILWFDKLIDKTEKPTLNLKMGIVGRFSHKSRYVVAVVFVILVVVAFILQNNIEITYSEVDYDPVHQVFDLDNTFVVLYENVDEENISAFITGLEGQGSIIDVHSYGTILGQSLNEAEMASALEMDETLVGLVFRNYFIEVLPMLRMDEFLQFLQTEVAENPMFIGTMSAQDLEQLSFIPMMMEEQVLDQEFTALELAGLLQMDAEMIDQMLQFYDLTRGERIDERLALGDFLQFLQIEVAGNPMFEGAMSPEDMAQLELLPEIIVSEMLSEWLSASELADALQMDESMVSQLLHLYDFIHGDMLTEEMTLAYFIDYLVSNFAQIPMFEASFPAEALGELESVSLEMAQAGEMFVSDNYSRTMIHTTFDFESTETFMFIDQITQELEETLTGQFYILGTSAMPREMNQTFPSESSLITLLTTIAFFVVVAISFKSMAVSAILAIVIQAAVFITMGVTYFQDGGIMFLPLIIAQVLLKSRVIDYGILYTANYIEARRNHGVKEAIITALDNSIDTILTSGLIIVVITFVVGLLFRGVNVAISEILLLIAQGCFIGVMLSIFVLPSLVAVFDRFVIRAKAKAH